MVSLCSWHSGPGCACTVFLSPRSKTAKMGAKTGLPASHPVAEHHGLLINNAAFGGEKRSCSVITDTLGEKLNLVGCNLAFIPALPDYFPDGAGQPCSTVNEALKLNCRWESSHAEVRAAIQKETWTETPNVWRKAKEVTSAELIESSNTLSFTVKVGDTAVGTSVTPYGASKTFTFPGPSALLSSSPLSFRPTSWSGIIKAVVRAAACTCANKH